MAYGDPIQEASCLLPGGSRVEAVEVEEFSAASVSRKRSSTVLLISSIAVVACMAVIAVHSVGNASTVELAEIPQAQTSKLPSWLRTDPVKLVPLNKLIQEREMMHKLAEGKISDKIFKEEHAKEGPTPHELAMRSVHVMAQRKQQLASKRAVHHEGRRSHGFQAPRSASEKASEEGFDRAQAAAVKHALHLAREKAAGKLQAKSARENVAARIEASQHVHVGRVAHVVSAEGVQKELVADKHKLAHLEHDESREIAAIQKHELHELAQLKYKDHVKAMKLKMEIKELRKEEEFEKAKSQAHPAAAEAQPAATSEKAKIKAEMARIEEEEQKKLEKLKAKLTKVEAHHHEDKATPPAALKKSAPPQSTGAQLAPKAARSSQLAEVPAGAAKPACTTDDCDLGHEDGKWLAHKQSVDYYARLATTGTGAQKAAALQKMKELEAQITHDYHHVTAFAVAQEHALPPAPH